MSDGRRSNREFSGRGSSLKPANRFLPIVVHDDFEQLDSQEQQEQVRSKIATEYYEDESKSILSENSSPDIPFRFSLNPYRGCSHGCSYCYARPSHEYLGFNAGIDFESRIVVKRNAAQLLEAKLRSKSWVSEPIMMSGVTDCYQPAERTLELTRACLKVARDFKQPIGIVTKNALVTRDIDVLSEMAKQHQTRVAVSLTSLDQSLIRKLEPRTSAPAARLRAMQELADAGIEVTVMTAPVIPGLNDDEIPALLEAARDHGATNAGYVLLRLPLTVEPVFMDWLDRQVPTMSQRVRARIEQSRGGKRNQSEFGTRMRGTGVYADHLSGTFKLFAKKYQLSLETRPLDCSRFQVPPKEDPQLRLF